MVVGGANVAVSQSSPALQKVYRVLEINYKKMGMRWKTELSSRQDDDEGFNYNLLSSIQSFHILFHLPPMVRVNGWQTAAVPQWIWIPYHRISLRENILLCTRGGDAAAVSQLATENSYAHPHTSIIPRPSICKSCASIYHFRRWIGARREVSLRILNTVRNFSHNVCNFMKRHEMRI